MRVIPIIIIIATVVAIGVILFGAPKNNSKQTLAQATIYQDPNCGCCGNYANYLSKNGIKVKVIKTQDIALIKENHKIPRNLQSCHTVLLENYIIEGHVPFEAILKLLEKKPKIKGIALPGMPPGSPGMPGVSLNPFVVRSLDDSSLFMEI